MRIYLCTRCLTCRFKRLIFKLFNEDSGNSLNDETEDIDGVKRNIDELDDISRTGDRSIETGDKSMLPTYAAIAGVSVLALLLLLKKRK